MIERIRRGWDLAVQSWGVLRADASLAIFPIISAGATVVAFALIFAPGLAWAAIIEREWVAAPFLVLAAYAATFISIYFNVALAAAARLSLDGKDTTLADGLSVASQRKRQVAGWAAVQLVVGFLINAIEGLVSDSPLGRIVGAILGAILQAAWFYMTFFIVPVIALEGLDPRDARRRSTEIMRSHWGEGVVGSASISLVIGLLVAPIVVLAVLAAGSAGVAVTIVLVAAAVIAVIVAAVIGSALNVIFRVALYRYATDGVLSGGFDGPTMDGAFTRKG